MWLQLHPKLWNQGALSAQTDGIPLMSVPIKQSNPHGQHCCSLPIYCCSLRTQPTHCTHARDPVTHTARLPLNYHPITSQVEMDGKRCHLVITPPYRRAATSPAACPPRCARSRTRRLSPSPSASRHAFAISPKRWSTPFCARSFCTTSFAGKTQVQGCQPFGIDLRLNP